MIQGRVFNIQRFSIHDGPGIRTSVFLKGCNLKCLWCHNPESRFPRQEVQFFPQKCVQCGKCVEVCPEGAQSIDANNIRVYDREACRLHGACVENCMHDALVFVYQFMQPDEVVEIVLKDADYYRNSGGGLTISGGEPLLQKEFVRAVFERTKKLGIHNALDTAANTSWEDIQYVLPYVDIVLLDLKSMDDSVHTYATGTSNQMILENAHRLAHQEVDIIIRIPVVPGINATLENMLATAKFLRSFPRLKGVDLLPYHDLGVDKYASLGYSGRAPEFETPSDELLASLALPFAAQRIPVKIGAG